MLFKKKAEKIVAPKKSGKEKPVKKQPVKKVKKAAPAKKVAAKKAPVKKAPAKKVAVKTAPKKKAPVKKAPVKKVDLKDSTRVYHVVKRPEDGKWAVKFAGGEKVIKLFETQKEAIDYSKKMAKNQEGKMLVHNSKGQNKGKIKSK